MERFKNQIIQHLQRKLAALQSDNVGSSNHPEVAKLLQELEVHQVELEMQNEELRHSQQQFAEAHHRYLDLYDFAPVGYVTLTTMGYVEELNLTAAVLRGQDRERLLQRSFVGWLAEGESPKLFRHLAHTFSSDEKATVELELRDGNGQRRHVLLESVAISADGAMSLDGRRRCRTAIIDLSWKKRAEQALRQSQQELECRVEERTQALSDANAALREEIRERQKSDQARSLYAKVFASTSEAIMINDCLGRITEVNAAFARITGYEESEVLGQHWRFMQRDQDIEAMEPQIHAALTACGQWQAEVWNRRKSGELYPAWEATNTLTDEQGQVTHYVTVFSDISSVKHAEAKLAYLAHHDPLTSLPNRLLFQARLEQSLELARRHQHQVALLFLDLDRFKIINDTMGHGYGDLLLQEVAQRIQGCVRAEDTVARLGGDEFTVLLSEINEVDEVARLADKILKRILEPVILGEERVVVGTSIGISLFPDDANNGDELTRTADAAMYKAKEYGRERFEFYTTELTTRALEHKHMEQSIRRLLAQDQFNLHYQPQFEMASGRLVGLEALLRCDHAELARATPERIVRIAEENGLIKDIDAWALRSACAQAAVWRACGLPPVRIAINLSARNIMRDRFSRKVRAALEEFQIPAEWIELEITEHALQTGREAIQELWALKDLGVGLAIDDFGTGYSSLSSIKQLPIDRLKIDRHFIADILHDHNDRSIVKAIISMAHNLNLKVIAEGVESPEQWVFLKAEGCDEVQGFHLSEPLNALHIEPLLRRERPMMSELANC